jgi:hypothetical protein
MALLLACITFVDPAIAFAMVCVDATVLVVSNLMEIYTIYLCAVADTSYYDASKSAG